MGDSGSSDSSQCSRVKGKRKYKAYTRSGAKIPRTTLLNWKRATSKSNNDSDTSESETSVSATSVSETNSSSDPLSSPKLTEWEDSSSDASSETENSAGSCDDLKAGFSGNDSESGSDSDHDQGSSNEEDSGESDDSLTAAVSSLRKCLYTGCKMSVDEVVYKIMKIFLENRLPKKALNDILGLIIDILPDDHALPHSQHLLFQYVRDLAPPFTSSRYYYCNDCIFLVGSEVPNGTCPCCVSNTFNFFISISLSDQLKYFFENRNLAQILEDNKRTVTEENINVISDITDGIEYLRVKCSLNQKYDLILVVNTDGIQLADSSKSSLWPIMCTITQVPPELRKHYLIVCGIWYDSKKPKMNTFLQPFCLEVREIFEKGLEWTHPRTNLKCSTRVTAPLFIADAPARADILNCEQHMSKYGCNLCTQKSKAVVMSNEKKNRRFFVFQEERAKLRTDKSMQRNGDKAVNEEKSFKGVKGPSVISTLPFLDRSTCVLPEYLHSLCLGVVKMVMLLWFTKPGPWNVSQHIRDIDDFLLQHVHPIDDISRLPRSVLLLKKWKASEFLNWLIFYSVPIMAKFWKNEHFQHWILLVISVELLSGEKISNNDLNLADRLLRLFLRDVGILYTEAAYKYNVHQLEHLSLCVRRWGPLWATSAFLFESFNGILSRLIHGTKHIAEELLINLSLASGTSILKQKVKSDLDTYCTDGPEIGKAISKQVLSSEDKALLRSSGFTDFTLYASARKDGEIYTSKVFRTRSKRVNYLIQFETDDHDTRYGSIKCYVQANDVLFCIVNYLQVIHSKMFFHEETLIKVRHILPVKERQETILIKLTQISCKVLKVGDCICLRPNRYESNL